MALEQYQSQNLRTSSQAIDTGVQARTRVEISGADMLSAELSRFSATVKKFSQETSNAMAAKAGTADALKAGQKLNDSLITLDEEIRASIESKDNKKAKELMLKRAQLISEASKEAQAAGYFRVDAVYNNAANKVFADAFQASLPGIEAQARQLSNDDPSEFAKIYKSYADEMIKNAPNEDVAALMGSTLVRSGSKITAELQMADYKLTKAQQREEAAAAITLREGLMERTAASTDTIPGESAITSSPQLAAQFGEYAKYLEGAVNTGTMTSSQAALRLDNMRQKIELSAFSGSAQRAVEEGTASQFLETIPQDDPMYMQKLDIANKIISNDIIMQNKFDAQEKKELKELSDNRLNEILTSGSYIDMQPTDITSDPLLSTEDKRTLLQLRRSELTTQDQLADYDPNIIYTLGDRSEIAALPASKAQKASLYVAYDKWKAFKEEKSLGLHTPRTKVIEQDFINQTKENLYDVIGADAQKDFLLRPELMGDIRKAREDAAIYASQLNVSPDEIDVMYSKRFTENLMGVQSKWYEKGKMTERLNDEVKKYEKELLELNNLNKGSLFSFFEIESDSVAKTRAADKRRLEGLIEAHRNTIKSIGFE
jgi:hypothetical protein